MSQANIPDINPNITVTFEEAVNLLLASIALEELGLAHLINAEAEKIQHVIAMSGVTVGQLLDVNASVRKVLQDIIKKEMLLQFKLETVTGMLTSAPTTAS